MIKKRTKKVKIPRLISLGFKAWAVVDANGNALLLSYGTTVAYAEKGRGTRRSLYRLKPSLISSAAMFHHWMLFAEWEGHPELASIEGYNNLPFARVVAS